MRPEIPTGLEERVEQTYAEAGYATGSELVRDAVRRFLPQAEAIAEGEEPNPGVDALMRFDFLGEDSSPRNKVPLTVDFRSNGEGDRIIPRSVNVGDGSGNRFDNATRKQIVERLSNGATATLYVKASSSSPIQYNVVPDLSWVTEDLGNRWRVAKVHEIEIADGGRN